MKVKGTSKQTSSVPPSMASQGTSNWTDQYQKSAIEGLFTNQDHQEKVYAVNSLYEEMNMTGMVHPSFLGIESLAVETQEKTLVKYATEISVVLMGFYQAHGHLYSKKAFEANEKGKTNAIDFTSKFKELHMILMDKPLHKKVFIDSSAQSFCGYCLRIDWQQQKDENGQDLQLAKQLTVVQLMFHFLKHTYKQYIEKHLLGDSQMDQKQLLLHKMRPDDDPDSYHFGKIEVKGSKNYTKLLLPQRDRKNNKLVLLENPNGKQCAAISLVAMMVHFTDQIRKKDIQSSELRSMEVPIAVRRNDAIFDPTQIFQGYAKIFKMHPLVFKKELKHSLGCKQLRKQKLYSKRIHCLEQISPFNTQKDSTGLTSLELTIKKLIEDGQAEFKPMCSRCRSSIVIAEHVKYKQYFVISVTDGTISKEVLDQFMKITIDDGKPYTFELTAFNVHVNDNHYATVINNFIQNAIGQDIMHYYDDQRVSQNFKGQAPVRGQGPYTIQLPKYKELLLKATILIYRQRDVDTIDESTASDALSTISVMDDEPPVAKRQRISDIEPSQSTQDPANNTKPVPVEAPRISESIQLKFELKKEEPMEGPEYIRQVTKLMDRESEEEHRHQMTYIMKHHAKKQDLIRAMVTLYPEHTGLCQQIAKDKFTIINFIVYRASTEGFKHFEEIRKHNALCVGAGSGSCMAAASVLLKNVVGIDKEESTEVFRLAKFNPESFDFHQVDLENHESQELNKVVEMSYDFVFFCFTLPQLSSNSASNILKKLSATSYYLVVIDNFSRDPLVKGEDGVQEIDEELCDEYGRRVLDSVWTKNFIEDSGWSLIYFHEVAQEGKCKYKYCSGCQTKGSYGNESVYTYLFMSNANVMDVKKGFFSDDIWWEETRQGLQKMTNKTIFADIHIDHFSQSPDLNGKAFANLRYLNTQHKMDQAAKPGMNLLTNSYDDKNANELKQQHFKEEKESRLRNEFYLNKTDEHLNFLEGIVHKFDVKDQYEWNPRQLLALKPKGLHPVANTTFFIGEFKTLIDNVKKHFAGPKSKAAQIYSIVVFKPSVLGNDLVNWQLEYILQQIPEWRVDIIDFERVFTTDNPTSPKIRSWERYPLYLRNQNIKCHAMASAFHLGMLGDGQVNSFLSEASSRTYILILQEFVLPNDCHPEQRVAFFRQRHYNLRPIAFYLTKFKSFGFNYYQHNSMIVKFDQGENIDFDVHSIWMVLTTCQNPYINTLGETFVVNPKFCKRFNPPVPQYKLK